MITPTLKALQADDIQDLRNALLEALDLMHKVRAVANRTFRDVENEHYETEKTLNGEIHDICADLDRAQFWSLCVLRNMEAAA